MFIYEVGLIAAGRVQLFSQVSVHKTSVFLSARGKLGQKKKVCSGPLPRNLEDYHLQFMLALLNKIS